MAANRRSSPLNLCSTTEPRYRSPGTLSTRCSAFPISNLIVPDGPHLSESVGYEASKRSGLAVWYCALWCEQVALRMPKSIAEGRTREDPPSASIEHLIKRGEPDAQPFVPRRTRAMGAVLFLVSLFSTKRRCASLRFKHRRAYRERPTLRRQQCRRALRLA
jgi:hypothetical protein